MFIKNRLRYLFAGLIILLFWSLVGFVAYKKLSTTPAALSYCNDYGCTNFRDGSNWAIRDCQGSTTGDGNKYTCDQKGRTGTCGTMQYCCSGAGMLWTTDMTVCNQSQQSSDCCACPTPTPFLITSQCNGPCMSSENCTIGNICLFQNGFGWVCRNSACYKSTACNCASVSPSITPTPTPMQNLYRCGEPCLSTAECQTDLRCVSISNTRECRNPECPEKNTCLCIE